MNTTVVAQSAIGALAALIGGLGGAAIATRPQRSNELRRQRERAAEVLGLVGPLVSELSPGGVLEGIPPLRRTQKDAIVEALAELDERVRVAREQLSTLAGWWSTPEGSDLAWMLESEISVLHSWVVLVFEHDLDEDLRGGNVGRAYQGASTAWRRARQLADELRREIRGEAAPPPSKKLLLPARPESWTGPARPRIR
jgi:hypothetical protein